MASQWYCRLMGTELGPYTSKELLEMARQHQITPEDSVRKGPDGAWVEARLVKGLFEDGSMSTIIMARLPPDVQQALERKHHDASPASNVAPTDSSGHFAAAKAEPTSVSWHYLSDEGKVGPLRFDQLVEHCQQGRLKPKTRVWSSASPKWCQAAEIEGLGLEKGVGG
jgi:hypothetical protein